MTVIVNSPPKNYDNTPTLPDWLPPLDTGQPSAQDINDLSEVPRTNYAARNTPIPIPYGRDRYYGKPFVITICETTGCLMVAYAIGEGEIGGYESVIVDGDDILTAASGYYGLKNAGFQTGDSYGWDEVDGTIVADEGRSGTGDYAARLAALAGGPQITSPRLPVPYDGATIKVSGWARRDPASLPDANAVLTVRTATVSGGTLTYQSHTNFTGDVVAETGTSGWQYLEGYWTLPAGVVEFVLHAGEANGTTGHWFWDDLHFDFVNIDGSEFETPLMEFNLYRGEPGQGVNGMLYNALTGFSDTYDGLAYIVGRFPPGSTSGFPRVEVIYQGRKVYDPRKDSTSPYYDVGLGVSTHRADDSTTWEYSTNPTLCFRDMVTNFSGWQIDGEGVADLATYNDEIITGSIPRREIGLTITKPGTVEKWTKLFRTYMGGFIAWEAGKIRVVPNRADVEAAGVLVLDGTADTYCDMGDQAELDFTNTDDWTLEFKFKMRDTTGAVQSLVTKRETVGSGATAVGYSLHINVNEELAVRLADGTTTITDTDTTTNFVDNEWHHIALVRDGATNDEMIVYVDGVARSPVDTSGMTGSLANTEPFRIGTNGLGSQRGDVLIDEVRVWDDIRTAQEIADNIDTEITDPSLDASLIGYWRMNEVATATSATDYSISANNGTLSGAASFLTTTDSAVIPEGVAMHITADDIVKDSLRIRRRSLRSVPNSVAVDYRDATGTRWRGEREQTDSPRLAIGAENRRLSRISLPGIHNATQAKREATERLNWYLTDLECTLTLFDPGWELQHGSIVAVTHPIGLAAKLFRVTRMTAVSGRWTVDMTEYDPAVYSSEVVADPTVPDTNLGDPLNPPLVTGLSAVEELFNYKNGNTGSRLRVTFSGTNYPFFSQYLLEGYVDGVKVWQTNTQSTEVVTPPVEELVTLTAVDYTVRVYTQSPFATGDFVDVEVAIQGKLAPPSDVPSISVVQTAADTVELNWQPATDIDIWRYEIRRGSTSDTWATATQIPQQLLIDGLSTTRTGIPVGTYRFFVKAIDSVGNESVNAKTTDVTLAVPQPATSLTGFEIASEVRLAWNAPATGFGERYRVSYDTIPESDEVTLDIVDTLRFSTKDVPEGTWRFKVTTQDKNGVEAATAPSIDIEVTSDADSFLADTYNFVQNTTSEPNVVTNGSLTNMHQFFLRLDDRLLYVTNMGDVFSSSPSDFNTYAGEALANYHSSGTSEWLSETVDFGLLLTGSWNLTQDVETLAGAVAITLELSTDNVSFTDFTGAAKGEFRYARTRIKTLTTSTAFVKSPQMNLKINVVPLEESGVDASSTTQGKTVNLEREYTAVKEINAQPRDKTDGLMAVIDNIIVGSNTAVQNNTTAHLTGGDIADLEFSGAQDFTVEFWMKHSGGAQGAVIVMGKRNALAAGWSVGFNETTEDVSLTIDDGTTEVTCTITDGCPNDGEYHHIAFAVDRTGDVITPYADAVAGSTTDISTVTGALSSSTAEFRIFADNAGANIWQNGYVDEVRIWDDIRSGAEISTNYQSELDMTQNQLNLLHYWQMNGDVGSFVATTGTAIEDRDAVNNDHLVASSASAITFVDVGTDPNNVILKINSFDVYVFDIFGQQLLEQFQWNWKGV